MSDLDTNAGSDLTTGEVGAPSPPRGTTAGTEPGLLGVPRRSPVVDPAYLGKRRRRQRRRLILAGVAIVAAIAFLVGKGLTSALVYFKTANQAVADRAQLGSQSFRIEGIVVPGSVRTHPRTVDFSIESKGVVVPVVDQGSPPQLFKPDIPVVLDGHFQGSYFASNEIMVKHSQVYIAAHPNRVRSPSGSVQ